MGSEQTADAVRQDPGLERSRNLRRAAGGRRRSSERVGRFRGVVCFVTPPASSLGSFMRATCQLRGVLAMLVP